METTFTIDGLIRSFTSIYQQFSKGNISVIEAEMRKIVPSENSTVLITAGGCFTENYISIDIFLTQPLPENEVQELTFDTIMKRCLLKTDTSRLAQVADGLNFIENALGEFYFIDAAPIYHDEEDDDYHFHFVISKENKTV